MHRLAALKQLGGRSVIALVLPEHEVAYRILALNTEKAHALRDKSLECIRMARGLAATPLMAKRAESDWAFEFAEPAYVTRGLCYEQKTRFGGSAYLPILKRCEEFSADPLAKALARRERSAQKLLALDESVATAVAALRAAGLKSSYLTQFVVARI